MKKLFYFLSFGVLIGLSACEKDEDDTSTQDPNQNNPSNTELTNNTLIAGEQSASLNKFSIHRATDVNTNKDYIDISVYKDNFATNRENYILFTLGEIPTASKTLQWQSSSNAPGDITADEFVIFPKVADKRWYGVYSSEAFTTTGELHAELENGKLTLWFEKIKLADNYISVNVNEEEEISGKFTFNLADLQNISDRPVEYDLVAE